MSGIFDQIINYSPPLIVSGTVNYDGTWNASTNTPTLNNPPAASTKGDYYVVSVAGTQFGITFAVGDWIISNGTAWEKVDLTDSVSSVFGRTGAVVGVSTDYSAVGITNTAIGAANPSTGAFTTVSASTPIAVASGGTGVTSSTGTTNVVLSNSPTLVTPNLGTPSAIVLTNASGTASININGTVGATTPSTVAATSLALSPFLLSAASTSVLRFSGTQAANVFQGFDGTNAYGVTLFNAGAANVVIQSNGASSFAGGINSTPLGTGGASTVAATTISATGQITSTLASGTAPFVVASTTNIPNLNASSLNGATFAAPGAIGSGTASTGAFTTLASTTGANFATSSGSVGIGTASPAAKLHVNSGTQKLVKTVTVNSSTQTIVTNSTEGVSGLCWIRDASVGGQALVLWDVSFGLTIVSQLGSIFTTSSPSATQIQLSVGGTSPYYVQAIAGATRDGDSLSISAINNQ
jgi:hypothetical protein